MDQDRLRQLASPDEVRNELVKQFTKHIEEEQEDPDDSVVKVKLVVVGPAGGGKTSWVTKLIQNKFNQAQQPTIGAKFSSQGVAIEDFVYNFDIWDVSGDEWYKSLVPMYLQYAQAVVICYDTSSAKSFEEAKSWIQYVKDVAEKGLVLCLVGMKSDLLKEESRQEGVETTGVDTETVRKFFVEENGLEKDFFFPSVSAKTGENVHDVLLTVAEAMHDRGVKAPRGSVMDPETAYRFANKAAQNQNTLLKTTNNNQNNTLLKIVDSERVDQAKEKMSECYVYLHKVFGVCFESSKQTAKKTFESTRKNVKEMSKTMDRRSRKIGADLQKRTAQLIRKTQRRKSDEENEGSLNVYGGEERENDGPTGQAPKIERLKG